MDLSRFNSVRLRLFPIAIRSFTTASSVELIKIACSALVYSQIVASLSFCKLRLKYLPFIFHFTCSSSQILVALFSELASSLWFNWKLLNRSSTSEFTIAIHKVTYLLLFFSLAPIDCKCGLKHCLYFFHLFYFYTDNLISHAFSFTHSSIHIIFIIFNPQTILCSVITLGPPCLKRMLFSQWCSSNFCCLGRCASAVPLIQIPFVCKAESLKGTISNTALTVEDPHQ